MKKIFLAVLLITAILLSACGQETEYFKEKMSVVLTPYDMPKVQPKWVTLYYPNQDNMNLLAFSQQITVDGSIYEDIMKALLLGTEEGYISPFPQGVSCRSIMLIQNILYIDMSWQFNEMPVEQFFACISVLASTFTGLNEVSFINVTVEGQQLTLPEMKDHPIMLLSSYTGTVSALTANYNRFKDKGTVIENFYGAIYVQDETGSFILPKALSMTVKEEGYASTLVSALLAESTAIFPAGFMLTGEPAYDASTGQIRVDLTCPQEWNYNEGWLGPHAIVSTLNSMYSLVKSISLKITDPQGNERALIEENTTEYFSKIKSVVRVLTPNATGTGLMHTNMLVSNMPGSGDVKSFINEYICALNPDFRSAESIVNGVVIDNDTVILDLDSKYFEHYYTVSATQESEYAIIYSLIYTACTYTGTSRALILQDSQLRSTLAGYIKIDQELLSLPSEYVGSIA